MQNIMLTLSGPSQPTTKGSGALQTVEEAEFERFTLPPDSPALVSGLTGSKPKLEQNPSRRPLYRRAHDHQEAYHRQSETAKRNVYAQEGDVEPSEFKETVAELLKEGEYGVFRLVVPHVDLDRSEFDKYVRWLNKHKQEAEGKVHRSVYGLPMVQPFSAVSLSWTCLMTAVDLTWTAFGVPINVAFCSVDYGRLASSCTATDLSFGIVYTLNLLVSFNMGVLVVNGHRKKTVMEGKWVAWYYMRYGRFILDIAATVPFVYLVVVLGISHGEGYKSKAVNLLSLIRLVRLLRLVSVSKVIYIDSTLGSDSWLSQYLNVSTLYISMIAFQTIVLINLIACILVLLAYMHGLEDSWMTAVDWTDLPSSSRAYQWYCAMYWVITTATTTGFGDFAPRWWAEQVVIGFAMVGGMIAFGILVGSVANGLARANSAADRLQKHNKKISQFNNWLSSCRLHMTSRMKIQEYFAQVFVAKQSEEYGEAELFADLPPYLRFEVASELALPLVGAVHALSELNGDAQQLIAAHLRPIRAIVGQELCRQGDEADRLWLLASGRLVALRHKEEPQHVAAPALVGESLILAIDIPQCRHRPWTLRAALPCELWELQLSDLSRVIQIYPAIRLCLLEHVRKDLVKAFFTLGSHTAEDRESPVQVAPAQDWCELSAMLQEALKELHDEDPVTLDQMCIEMERANIDDGSLQARLGEVIEGAMVRDGLTPEAVLGLPLLVQQQVTQMAHGNSAPSSGGRGLYSDDRSGPTRRLAPQLTRHQQTQDPHHGPAPWGLTTEDALASIGRVGPGAVSAVTSQPGVRKDEAPGWHVSGTPPPPLDTLGGPGLPPPPLQGGRQFRRLASQQSSGGPAGISDNDSVHSERFNATVSERRVVRHAATTPPALDLSPAQSNAAAVGLVPQDRSSLLSDESGPDSGADSGPERGASGGTNGTAATSGLPPLLPSLKVDLDPIAAETGIASPSTRRQQDGGSDPRVGGAAGGPTLAAVSASAALHPQGSAPGAPSRASGPGTGAAAPGGKVAGMGAGLRRSMLSRMSSPFASVGAAGFSFMAGPPEAPGLVAGSAIPAASTAGAVGAAQASPGLAACVYCGAAACPQCGALKPAVPQHQHLLQHQQRSQPLPGALAPASGLARHSTAISLTDAVRGGGDVGIRYRNGGAAPPPLQLPLQQQQLQQAPSSQRWAASPALGSPGGALGRRSRMFGRSFAATVRNDSLVRNTLWHAYSQRDEEDLAAASVAAREGEES